jgi:anamorsin
MSPSAVSIDNISDFVSPMAQSSQDGSGAARTLLLAPPSIASHEEKLRGISAAHDRSVTDLQMLDRLSAGLVSLPATTYDLILVLTDADGTRKESSSLLTRDVFAKIVPSLKVGGSLKAQDGSLSQANGDADAREAVLAGLVAGPNGFSKTDEEEDAVPLKLSFGRNKKADAGPAIPKPAGVGFVDFSDDLDDEDLIDEDTLLTEEDMNKGLDIRE